MAASESGHNTTQSALAQTSDADRLSDVQIADVIAQALVGVPGVAALSAGRLGTAATYGPGQTVRGVAVRHGQGEDYTVEIHMVVASAELVDQSPGSLAVGKDAGGGVHAVLPTLAEAIRGQLAGVLRSRGVTSPAAVDVYFDDWT